VFVDWMQRLKWVIENEGEYYHHWIKNER
jgi:hypothetical protein